MQPYLVFGLTASLGAMGELAGHERRGSMVWPARSAVLGLLGAALGIRRGGDFAALDALSLAVAVFDEGVGLRDYHTIETVPSAAVKTPNSRPEALAMARGRTNTSITLRDYRAGVFYGVAVWGGALEPLQQALARPKFTLYFGRKSCPLCAPCGARVVAADSPEAALAALVLPPWRRGMRARVLIEAAEKGAETSGPAEVQGEELHDLPRDRARWHFAPRRLTRRGVEIAPGEGTA
ncbi:MAG: type I-E CRISPR-associated protein Cas5/CasD [Paracoccaceae bacterium]